MQWLSSLRMQCLRQFLRGPYSQRDGKEREKPEDGTPAEPHMQPAAENRRDGRRDRENCGHVRHDPLGSVPFVNIAHDGAPHDQAGAGCDTLQSAQEPEDLDRRRQRTTNRGQRQHRERAKNYPTPAQRIGDRAMPKAHQSERHEVRSETLLHLQRRGPQRRLHFVERGQVSVDRERPDHAQRCDQQRKRTRNHERAAPVRRIGGAHCHALSCDAACCHNDRVRSITGIIPSSLSSPFPPTILRVPR